VTPREIITSLGGVWHGSYGTAACPCCQPERRRDQMALSICERGGTLLLRCHKSACTFKDITSLLGITTPLAPKRDDEKRLRENGAIGFNRVKAAYISECLMALAVDRQHEYTTAKGFPDLAVPTITVRDIQSVMRVPTPFRHLPNSCSLVIVPLRNSARKLTSIQLISPEGAKYFLAGGCVKGSALRIGAGGRLVLCEGFATGLSISRCSAVSGLSVMVLCCMNALNIKNVARILKNRSFQHVYAVADNDVSGTGMKAASFADRWVMPPEPGDDFNDYEQRDQPAATRLMRSLIEEA